MHQPDFERHLAQAKADGIDVVIVGAYVCVNGKVLLLQRVADEFYGGFFEMPSGHPEGTETLGQALVRELQEEAGITIHESDIRQFVDSFDYMSSDKTKKKRQLNFLVVLPSEPKVTLSSEHQGMRWVDPTKLDDPAFDDVLKDNLRAVAAVLA